MAYYYSASERAFFSSDLVSTGAMPADKVAVTDADYRQLMADQVAGKLIRPGAGNAPESANQNLTEATRFGDISMGKLTSTGLDLNGNADISGTLKVTGTSTLGAVNASNVSASGTLTVTGGTTLTGKLTANGGISTKALSATSISNSGALTNSGNLTVNGSTTVKALTATGLDLNGNADVSGTFTAHGKSTFAGVSAGDIDAKTLDTTGNVNVGGLLAVTGDIQGKGFVDTTNSGGEGFRLIDSRLDAVDGQNYRIQDWPVRVVDRDGRTVAMAKYVKDADGSSQFLLAEVTYSSTSDTSGNWAQITIGHEANGDRYFETALPTALTGGLTVSGGASLTGSVDVDGNITSDAAVTGHVLQTKETSGNVIRTLISGYSKGTKPSSRVTAYWGIYDKDGIGGNSDQVGAVSFGADTDGGTQMFMTAYRSDTSGLYPSSITVGWDSSNKAYAWVTGSFTVGAELTVAKGITVTGGNVSISSGDFRTGGTCGVDIYDKTIDGTKAPSSTQQRWLARVLDVNEKTVGMLKVNQGTDGSQNIQIVSVLNSSDGSQKMNGLSVGYNANGDAFSIANTPENDSNGDNIATTKWVRAYNWDADRAQIVHTVNNETIDGTKTFKRSISVSANPLIQSTNWSGIGIADSTRSATTNKMMAQILDKDGKRFLGLEVTSGNDGSRQFQFNARNRNDNGWTIFLRCIEYADGTQNLTAGQHPPAGDNSLRLATTGWVVSQLSSAVPTGAIMFFAQNAVPSGWLLCNGANVSRTTYANLFAVIGTRHGAGNGSTTFTLPNLNDRFAEGTTTTNNVGQVVQAGLPNITGDVGFGSLSGGYATGAFSYRFVQGDGLERDSSGLFKTDARADFNAGASNTVYGASSTVQPPAIRLLPCIKS